MGVCEKAMRRSLSRLLGISSLLIVAGAVVVYATTNYPSWWITRGVVDTNATPNDFAPVVAGQLKWIAVNAADEMATNLPGGAGTGIQARVSEFSPSNNYVGVNLGQLKYVSEPFYVRLIQEQYTNSYPWSTNSTGDDANYSPANIGQLKNVFSFDVMADPDEDGMPDWWEMVYFGTLTNASGGDCDGDGLANSAEFVAGSDPTDSDTDDDGMTDDWEVEYDLDVRDSADASEDADGDTFSNLEEYTMGTDPGEPDPVNNAAFRLNSGCGDIYFVSNQVSGSTAYGDLATMQQVSQEQAEQGSFSLYSCAGDIYTADSGFHASSTDTYTTIYRESAMFTSSSGAALVLIIDSYKDAPPGPGEYMGGLLLYRAHLLGTPIVYRTNDATAQITVISENEFTWSVDLDYAGGVVEIRVPWSVFTVVGVPLLDIDEEETDSALCLGCGCSNCAADITVKARPSVETGHLEVVVMDGNDLIAEIYDDNCFGGTYHLQWDGTMTNGQPADPGTYTIDAAWTIGTNDPCTDSEEISVLKVEITPTNRVGCPHCLTNVVYALTNSFVPNGVTWSIDPSGLSGGATITPAGNQASVTSGTLGTTYVIRATSVDNTNCFADAGMTVYVPGDITQTGNAYTDTATESHKVITHQFSPTPQGNAAAQHFCFVQTLQGYMRQADGTNYFLVQIYGSLVDFNFTNSQIDSADVDPAYWSPPHYGHHAAGGNVYFVEDDPHPPNYNIGVKCDVNFQIGVYCTNDVPTTGAASQPSLGTPFDTKTWDYRVTVTTNAAGTKIFTHP